MIDRKHIFIQDSLYSIFCLGLLLREHKLINRTQIYSDLRMMRFEKLGPRCHNVKVSVTIVTSKELKKVLMKINAIDSRPECSL